MDQPQVIEPVGDPLIDRFIDALWLEDGLAQLTLAAYRRDLALFNGWLQQSPVQQLLNLQVVREVQVAPVAGKAEDKDLESDQVPVAAEDLATIPTHGCNNTV